MPNGTSVRGRVCENVRLSGRQWRVDRRYMASGRLSFGPRSHSSKGDPYKEKLYFIHIDTPLITPWRSYRHPTDTQIKHLCAFSRLPGLPLFLRFPRSPAHLEVLQINEILKFLEFLKMINEKWEMINELWEMRNRKWDMRGEMKNLKCKLRQDKCKNWSGRNVKWEMRIRKC